LKKGKKEGKKPGEKTANLGVLRTITSTNARAQAEYPHCACQSRARQVSNQHEKFMKRLFLGKGFDRFEDGPEKPVERVCGVFEMS
jgi:hypothetical protein